MIHGIAPIYNKEDPEESIEYLKKCINNILEKANGLDDVKSLSIPAISSGCYGFSMEKCAEIIINTCIDWLKKNGSKSQL